MQPGFGDSIRQPLGAGRTSDFRDSDGDRIDDRDQRRAGGININEKRRNRQAARQTNSTPTPPPNYDYGPGGPLVQFPGAPPPKKPPSKRAIRRSERRVNRHFNTPEDDMVYTQAEQHYKDNKTGKTHYVPHGGYTPKDPERFTKVERTESPFSYNNGSDRQVNLTDGPGSELTYSKIY